MSAVVEGELTTVAFCWRLERRDGVCLGFTAHDRDLGIGGLTYRATPGMLPSAIALSDGFDADTLDVDGALSSDAITAADLAAGRWDGASVRIFLVDWQQPEGELLPLARGELGEVSVTGQGFTAELRGPTARLARPVVDQTSPECRARLGDKKCRIDMAARISVTRIAALSGEDAISVEAAAPGVSVYRYGRLRWLSGANSGLESAILESDGTLLTLREPAVFGPAVGDLVEISEGCDKTLATCRDRFANAANFRGEPHLPGVDLLTRYGAS